MQLKFESKSNVCPKSLFSFVLNFLFWKWNPVIALCTNIPLYLYSEAFATLNMVLNLGLNSYFLLWQLPATEQSSWNQSIDVWRFHMTLQVPFEYLQRAQMLYSVQATARNLYALLVAHDYAHLLGGVTNVPVALAFELTMSVWNLRRENCGTGGCRRYLWIRTVKHVTTVLYWSAICCLLYRRFVGCVFEE